MTKITTPSNTFIIPVSSMSVDKVVLENDVFRHLLKGRTYVAVGNQILFEREGQYFLTMIDNHNQKYTKKDYDQLPYKAPYQLIDGKLEYVASPKDKHQDTLGNLYMLLAPYVKTNKIGRVRFAPLDVHFDEKNIYQPDLMFISNERKDIIKDFIYGPPDLIVEVLSSNKKHDLGERKDVYGQYEVLEYWAVDYKKQTLDAYLNKEKKLIWQRQYTAEDEVKSEVVEGFSFVLKEILKRNRID
ncbi:MAG: Uma2 family endonuclease [Bacteroidota bacterium]